MTATTLRQMWHVAPHAGAHHPALRMAIAALVPPVLLTMAGQPTWAGWALLGAVTAAYARSDSPRRRLRVQAMVGLVLVLLVIIATVLAAAAVPGIVLVLATAVVAGLATVLADAGRWSPPGALFPVFVFGAASAIPAGFSTVGLLWALSVTASSDFFRTRSARPSPNPPQPSRAVTRTTALHAAICFAGAAVAGSIALTAGLRHPSWAMVAAVVPVVGVSTGAQILRAGHRLVGTLLGVLVAGVLFLHAPGPLEIAVLTAVLLFGAELLIARNYSLALLFITPLTIGMSHPDTPDRLLALMADRALETVIGVVVAVALIAAAHRIRPKLLR
ncbi:FUSC family protein [Actinoplanes couchii]|uniref:FUSC family protein n=1 Tax=Actinoplanes couchii TaxID=403638 RepID=A0ABQ3XE83_9ACTN|nr:FUSC family protein [Actinoplanes couchii]MDR6317318.1 putative membrane protein YccC [Actinoplanes couchii]GID56811.1 FUSC family protein [Actinoplanes couchii]